MAEYIEREKLSAKIDWDNDIEKWTINDDDLCSIPAADVAPVRRGQWGLYEDTHEHLVKYVCPFCYNYVGFRHDPGEDTVRGNYIYCHSCGAKLGDDEQ